MRILQSSAAFPLAASHVFLCGSDVYNIGESGGIQAQSTLEGGVFLHSRFLGFSQVACSAILHIEVAKQTMIRDC
jgi:hypothetical protein